MKRQIVTTMYNNTDNTVDMLQYVISKVVKALQNELTMIIIQGWFSQT